MPVIERLEPRRRRRPRSRESSSRKSWRLNPGTLPSYLGFSAASSAARSAQTASRPAQDGRRRMRNPRLPDRPDTRSANAAGIQPVGDESRFPRARWAYHANSRTGLERQIRPLRQTLARHRFVQAQACEFGKLGAGSRRALVCGMPRREDPRLWRSDGASARQACSRCLAYNAKILVLENVRTSRVFRRPHRRHRRHSNRPPTVRECNRWTRFPCCRLCG